MTKAEDLPSRPRQHQLETESRNHFQSAIPSRWVYRSLDQDYGIDGEVEIFNEYGTATGNKFLVQLKATDEKNIKNALRLRLPLSKIKYYHSLHLPVLIVKYHSPSGKLYWRWFHAFDPYYGKRMKNSIAFNFIPDDTWTDTTSERIDLDVEAYRHINSSHFPRPLHISISFRENEIHGVPAYLIHSRLREFCDKVKHLIFLDTRESLSNEIIVTKEAIMINIAGACACTLHIRSGYTKEQASSSLHFDIMIAIGIAIAIEGHILEAGDIIAPFLVGSSLIQNVEIALRLSFVLSNANKMDSAFEIAEELIQRS